ncbi:CatB-related O-acetyltransferase [Akkermansiaceae bacterium]|nr:CatB-related O-acetyltransferase [Akkermansiaceae bacterium]
MDSSKGQYVKIGSRHTIINTSIDNFSYVAGNSNIRNTQIGRFCSIGPNFMCGLAIHPINGVSTSPVFYSTKRQCGFSFCSKNKVKEFGNVKIGHDVFIGANVTILTNLGIGNGAVIAAGSVVVDDVPDYAIVGGVPAKVIRYRFPQNIIEDLLDVKWWDLPSEKLHIIESNFFDTDTLLNLLKR